MHNSAVLALPRQEFSGVSHQYQRCGNLRQPMPLEPTRIKSPVIPRTGY
jgi:hypothetical protein